MVRRSGVGAWALVFGVLAVIGLIVKLVIFLVTVALIVAGVVALGFAVRSLWLAWERSRNRRRSAQ